MLPTYCWAWDLTLRVVAIPNETLLEKTVLLFASGSLLEIASGLEVGACVRFLSQHWDPTWQGWMLPQSLWAHVCADPAVSGSSCFLGALHSPGSFNSASSFLEFPERWGRGNWWRETFRLGLSVPRCLTLCISSHHGTLFLFPSATGRIFSDDGWVNPDLI